MTGREFVFTMTRLYGYPLAEARRRTEEAIAEVGMTARANRRIAGCSHGMRQRIKLAQALVHDPEILLLDEPLTGIDPGGRREISQLFERQAERGKSILISSHILVEVEHLADSMLMIARGRIVASGTIREVRDLIEDQPFTVELVSSEPRRLAAALVALSQVRSVEVRGEVLHVQVRNQGQFFAALGELVLEHGLDVRQMQTLDAGADAVFTYLQRDLA